LKYERSEVLRLQQNGNMNFGQLLVFFVLKMFIFFEKTEDFKKIFKNLNEQRKSRK